MSRNVNVIQTCGCGQVVESTTVVVQEPADREIVTIEQPNPSVVVVVGGISQQVPAHNHNDLYYTEPEVDDMLSGVAAIQNDVANLLDERAKSLVWVFSTSTEDSDPGAGVLRFDNSDISSVGQIYIDNRDQSNCDQASWISGWGGQLVIQELYYRANSSIWTTSSNTIVFRVDLVKNASGYKKIRVKLIQGSLPQPDALLRVVGVSSPPLIDDGSVVGTASVVAITGTTDGSGRVMVDLTAAVGNRPALNSVRFLGGHAVAGGPIVGYPTNLALSTFTVEFYDVQSSSLALKQQVVLVVVGVAA